MGSSKVGAMISMGTVRLGLMFQRLKMKESRVLQAYVDADMQEILISEDLQQAMCS